MTARVNQDLGGIDQLVLTHVDADHAALKRFLREDAPRQVDETFVGGLRYEPTSRGRWASSILERLGLMIGTSINSEEIGDYIERLGELREAQRWQRQ